MARIYQPSHLKREDCAVLLPSVTTPRQSRSPLFWILIVAVVAIVLLLVGGVLGEARPSSAAPSLAGLTAVAGQEEPPSATGVANAGSPSAPSTPTTSWIDAGATRTGIDATDLADLEFRNAQLRARLERNAKRATEEVDRFCEMSDEARKHPPFPDPPGTRDAAVFMASRIDWEGIPPRLGSLHVAEATRAHLRPSEMWLTSITETDLVGLDFGWMKQLLAFDVWTFGGDGAADDLHTAAITSNIPNFTTLQVQAKLRFCRAFRVGDWLDAVREVRHLAYLTHTMSLAVSEAIAVALLKIEMRAREEGAKLGVDLSALPPLPDLASLDSYRTAAVKSGWFVAPGVPEAVRRRALECSPVKCATVVEGLSLQSSLRPWAPPGSMESFIDDTKAMGCDPLLISRLTRMPPATAEELQWLLQDEEAGILLGP